MTLGENLKRLRKDRGLSQDEVARKLFLSRQSVSKWELDRSEPGVENLKALSRLYGVTADVLLGNTAESGGLREKKEGLEPDDVFRLAVMLRVLIALMSVFLIDKGFLLYSWDLFVLLAGFGVRNRLVWGSIVIAEASNLLIYLIVTVKAFWYGWEPNAALPLLWVTAGFFAAFLTVLGGNIRLCFREVQA